jgi:hypothetical protein
MGLFGFGDTPQIPQAKLPSEYAGAFQRGQEFGYTDLEEARRVGQQQADLANALRAQAEGKAPSLAAMQYARALEQSQAAAASQLASARGLSPAQAQQMLLTRQAAAQQQAAGQSAQMRLQEQLAAQGMLGTLLGQQRQGSILGASTAGQFGATAGSLAEQARQAEQQRMLEQYRAEQAQRGQMERGIATAGGALLGGAIGSIVPGVGTAIGAEIGAGLGGAATGGDTKALSAGLETVAKRAGGGEIAGRSRFKGDTRSNDTVPALLSPGEIVLPRSVAQDEDAPVKAKKFVEAIKGKKKPTPKDYTQALARLKELESRMDAMEALADLEAENEG